MRKIRSFKLQPGTRIGNYQITEKLQNGYEGETYIAHEVGSKAIRVLKLFRRREIKSVRHLMHMAWYYEQVRRSAHFAGYYHYGNWILDSGLDCWFLVFEYVEGKSLKEAIKTSDQAGKEHLFFELAKAVADVHALGFAIGDFYTLENVFWSNERIIFIDCDPGTNKHPNRNFRNDCIEELIPAAKRIFGRKYPE